MQQPLSFRDPATPLTASTSHAPRGLGGDVVEFTAKAVVAGLLLGVVFGAANAYLGLRVGMTVSASIPAAVMTVAVFRLVRSRITIYEANLSQTVASASTALATGTIFTVPALFLWGIVPPYGQVVLLCLLGGVLGICAMIPLRRVLIVDAAQELPYPEGTACAQVLGATQERAAGARWIFYGIAAGAAVKMAVSVLFLIPGEVGIALPVLPQAWVGLEIAPALIGVGFILGFRQSAVIVAGAALSSLLLIPLIAHVGASLPGPLFPETTRTVSEMTAPDIWASYVRYIGAGAVACAALWTVIKTFPTMARSLAAVANGLRRKSSAEPGSHRTERDAPPWMVVGGIVLVVLVSAVVPSVFGADLPPAARVACALGVAVLGLVFVAVAARIVGVVGVSSQPTSGIALITLMVVAGGFVLAGWTDVWARAGALCVGTLVAIAASKAGDIAQDLKTGALLGATPARQQYGQLLGAAVACWAVAGTVLLLGQAWEFGSRDLPAPQAMLMKTVIEGVLSGALPWELVAMGAGLTLPVMLCGVPGLSFAIGVYLPLAAMAPVFLGGCVRALADRWRRDPRGEHEEHSNPGVLAASGLVAGEALAGVLVAAAVVGGLVPKSGVLRLGDSLGHGAAVAALIAISVLLIRAATSNQRSERAT